jgi:hypothetical protein
MILLKTFLRIIPFSLGKVAAAGGRKGFILKPLRPQYPNMWPGVETTTGKPLFDKLITGPSKDL